MGCVVDYIKKHIVRIGIIMIMGTIGFALLAILRGGGIKTLCVYALISFGSSILLLLPKLPNKMTIPMTLLYLFYVPQKIFDRFELPFHDMAVLRDEIPFLTILLILALYFVLYMITQHVQLAFGVGNIVIAFVFLAEYFVCKFRGTVIMPSDLSAVGTAMSVAKSYSFELSSEAWYSLAYFVFFTIWGFKCSIQIGKRWKIAISVILLCVVGGIYYLMIVSDYFKEHNITGDYWSMPNNHRVNGVCVSFMVAYREYKMDVPLGYSEGQLKRIAAVVNEQYMEQQISATRPNIIMVMGEAWSDLEILGEIGTTAPVTPFMDNLQGNMTRGNLYVSILGGLTANTEFEAITGNSLAFLAPTTIPYCNQVNHNMNSLATVLKQNGYQALAMHPAGTAGWNRGKVYDYLGFDEYIDVTKFKTEYLYVRGYLSDECNFNEIIYQYENRDKEKPFFLFDVTIQNHGGYDGGVENHLAIESINGKTPEEVGDILDLHTYMNMMKITDNALEKLITYFEGVEEPTIICLFGDHQPLMSENFYQAVFEGSSLSEEEKNMQKYIVPYVIWANYDVDLKDYGDFSANYLPAIVMECSGLELPPFYKFLMMAKEEYPILSVPGCVDQEGNMYIKAPEAEILKNYRLFQYNQLYDDALQELYITGEGK